MKVPKSIGVRSGLTLGALIVGTAAVVVTLRLTATADRELLSAVHDVLSAVRAGDVEAVWDQLAPSTIERFERSHAAMLDTVATYIETRESDPRTRSFAEHHELEYGLSLGTIARTSARSLWVHRTRQALDRGGGRLPFKDWRLDEIKSDGQSARVSVILDDGRTQGLHLRHLDDRWRLVDFQPFWRLEWWSSEARAGVER